MTLLPPAVPHSPFITHIYTHSKVFLLCICLSERPGAKMVLFSMEEVTSCAGSIKLVEIKHLWIPVFFLVL